MVQDDRTIAANLQTKKDIVWTDRPRSRIRALRKELLEKLMTHISPNWNGGELPEIIGYDYMWREIADKRLLSPFQYLIDGHAYYTIEILAGWPDEKDLISIPLFITCERFEELFPDMESKMGRYHNYGYNKIIFYMQEVFGLDEH